MFLACIAANDAVSRLAQQFLVSVLMWLVNFCISILCSFQLEIRLKALIDRRAEKIQEQITAFIRDQLYLYQV